MMNKSEFNAYIEKALARSGGSRQSATNAIASAHRKSQYKRDGSEHTKKGVPGHALVWCFAPLPEQSDLDENENVDSAYYQHHGIAVSQIEPIDKVSRDGDKYVISFIEMSFEDVWRHRNDLKHVVATRASSVALSSLNELCLATGEALMDVGIALIAYGAASKERSTRTMADAIANPFTENMW